MSTDRFGFSTGALERGNYHRALEWVREQDMRSVELSALRFEELEPLVEDLDRMHIDREFQYVSFHAPSSFKRNQEDGVVDLLDRVAARKWNIVVHPDVIYTPAKWTHFGKLLLVENMDRRKSTGRTVHELWSVFKELPDARMCLDVAHARQLDTTLTLLLSIAKTFRDRIAEIHISELDSRCHHRPLSSGAVADYKHIAADFTTVPVIIESMLDTHEPSLRMQEVNFAEAAMRDPQIATQLEVATEKSQV